jgi:hypothetical protein
LLDELGWKERERGPSSGFAVDEVEETVEQDAVVVRALIAQLAERILGKDEVSSSILDQGSILKWRGKSKGTT